MGVTVSMKVYQVVYEIVEPDGQISERFDYVTAPNLLIAAKNSQEHADQYKHELKSVRCLFNIVRQYE